MKYLKRYIDVELGDWKDSPVRRPLLVRGARQVGKTFSITHFGEAYFRNCLTINFEERPEFKGCFETLLVSEILEKIEMLSGGNIIPGETILFLDEIQECPRAITALRYFYEKKPELHVVGAGSLLEFAFKGDKFRMPVGRISSIFMEPLSFSEFLEALGRRKLNNYLAETTLQSGGIPSLYQDELEKALRKYFIIGGMPGVVAPYVQGISHTDVNKIQSAILQTYQADFVKYASSAQHKYLNDVFLAAPRLAGSQCKYSHINPYVQSRDLKNAITLLKDARCIYQIFHSSAQGLPLEAQKNQKKFKLAFLDIGLMQRSLGLDTQIMFDNDIMTINRGGVAEQYVAQQLLSSLEPFEEKKLYYWSRESRSSQAEVDFLVTIDGSILPVEVKSGKTGRLKSLRLFLKEHPDAPFGLRFSAHELSFHDQVLSIPLYMACHWKNIAGKTLETIAS
ncbi:MAG: AAA family ATPase [Thermodesulfobacteriota bacterium]|nr:AAA family ATPase [Thermodesulfobacteriota bacterium]